MLSRRGIFGGLGALLAAPAVVKVASLMQVRGIILPVGEGPPMLGQWLDLMTAQAFPEEFKIQIDGAKTMKAIIEKMRAEHYGAAPSVG